MTLIIGVYPDLFLNPITDYYTNNMFQGQEGVLLSRHKTQAQNQAGLGPKI